MEWAFVPFVGIQDHPHPQSLHSPSAPLLFRLLAPVCRMQNLGGLRTPRAAEDQGAAEAAAWVTGSAWLWLASRAGPPRMDALLLVSYWVCAGCAPSSGNLVKLLG